MTNGGAGFVIPFKSNIIYVEINSGDDFGQADIVACSIDHGVDLQEILKKSHLLTR